jgi:hypothetical protein
MHLATAPNLPAQRWATLAVALFAGASLALVALHGLRPELEPASTFVSNYAVGPYGGVMTAFFVTFSAGLVALVVGLARSGLRGPAGWIGMAALLVTAAGLIVTAIHPTDLPGSPQTRSGDIHELSFRVNVLGILLGVLALSAVLGARDAWRRDRRALRWLAALVVIALVLQFATLRKGLPYGLANRFFVMVVFAWMLFVAQRLRGIAAQPTSAG